MSIDHYQDQGLLEHARLRALNTKERHEYLPDTARKAEYFEPHEWVREAMRDAFEAGKSSARLELQKTLRNSLGIYP